ncbi:hypothetical protein ACTXPV_12875 [Corynebacterium glyciniphilum]
MRHRIYTALVCLPAVSLVLAGCSDDGDSSATTATSVTTASSVSSTTTTPDDPPEPNPTQGEVAPEPAPQPEPEPVNPEAETIQPEPLQVTGPQLGDQCIGADIGRTAVAADGTAIMCDNYVWQPNQGQTPSHPWVDGQREWAECLEGYTTEECREMLNP